MGRRTRLVASRQRSGARGNRAASNPTTESSSLWPRRLASGAGLRRACPWRVGSWRTT